MTKLNISISKTTTDNIATFLKDISREDANRADATAGINLANIGIYCETIAIFNAYPKNKISVADMKVLKNSLQDAGMTEGNAKRKAEKTQWAFRALRKDNKLPTQATPEMVRTILNEDYEVFSEAKLTSVFNPKKPLSKAETIIKQIFGEPKADGNGVKGGLDASDFAEFVTLYDAEKIAREIRVKAEAEAQAQKDAEVVAQDETAEAMDELVGDDMTSDDIPNAQADMDNNPFGGSYPKTQNLTELDNAIFAK